MEIFAAVVTLGLMVLLAIWFLYFIFSAILEPTYILLFNKPIFVHFYPFCKKLTEQQEAVLQHNFKFYRNLSQRRKRYFRHRVAAFIEKYEFAGREGLQVTDEMKIKIAATAIMLSFGMRNYLHNIFRTIIIYPDAFASANGDLHKGEFNPKARVVVFSWKHFSEGLEYDNDNLNLGLHEFAHVLHFDSLRRRHRGSSSVIYGDMFREMMNFVARPENRLRLVAEGYFREYAYTNQYEFLAVILEHFFETPSEFKQKFPELYIIVKKMINFRENSV